MRADTIFTGTAKEANAANHWADLSASRPPFAIEQAYYRFIANRLTNPSDREILRRVSSV